VSERDRERGAELRAERIRWSAGIATLCKPPQRVTDHSYRDEVSGSSPLVGSSFFLQNP
jgi:hypothetical protein